MGQGIFTSMAQMLAEELDVPLDSIDMVMGDTMLCPWDSGTTGSRSTRYYEPPLRRAGAEARAVLLQMAAEKLGVTPKQLIVKNGIVTNKNDLSRKVTYSELVNGKQINRHISDVPKIDAILIDNTELPHQGCGEPAITTVGAALANAIFDAVGARVYTLPLTPERILASI